MTRKVLLAFWPILMCLSVAFSAEPFKHPGVLVSKSQLDFAKSKISHEPWKSYYDKMMQMKFSSLSFETKPWKVVECGSYSHPDNGCTDEKDSAISAYTHALRD